MAAAPLFRLPRSARPKKPRRSPSGLRLALTLGVTLGLLGCGRLDRARDCERLSDTVNPRLAALAELGALDQTPERLEAIAKGYSGLAEELSPLEFGSESLAKSVAEFGRELKKVALHARRAADATRQGKRTLHSTARREVADSSRALAGLRQVIFTECR